MSSASSFHTIGAVEFLKAVHGPEFAGVQALFMLPSKQTAFFDRAQWASFGEQVDRLKSESNLYGVIGTQQKRLPARSRGSVATVRQVSGFIVDVDFASMKDTKKRYVADAAAAAEIRRVLPLSPSAVVSTGNGEHWHFFLDQPLGIEPPDEIETAKRITAEFSRHIQAIFREHGAEIDSVGDITRAFRIPGTINHKGGETKPVVLLEFDPAKRYRRAQIEQFIATAAPPQQPTRKKRPSDGFGRADHDAIRRGCSWYEHMTGGGAATASEPEWFAAASITACCRDGEDIFHAYSASHAGYAQGEAQKKFEHARRGDAPRTCHSIEADLGHEGCPACQYHGRIRSPVRIGSGPRRYDPAKEGPIPLGYTRDGHFALRDPVRNIILSANAQQLLSGQWLQGVAPSEFWGRQFPARKKPFDATDASEALIAVCKQAGPFDPLEVRGRGVWVEEGEIVINLGDPVRDGLKRQYLCFKPIPLPPDASFDTRRLADLLQHFRFRDPKNARLLLGWLAIAPICGVLDWRPHCFVYGPPKAGKSTLHRLATALITPLAISTTGDSSEAGIRQAIGPDSLPVIIDEFESDQRRGRLQSIIMLARSGSSGDTSILKGTPEGKAMQFSLRATFFFSAVNPAGLTPADASRILLFELIMHENDQEAARRITGELAYFADAGPRWCAYMASKALLIAPARLAFETEMPGMDSHLRTNIATLLGAGFVVLHGRIPNKEEVVAEAAEFATTTAEHAAEVDRDDAVKALHHLLAFPISGTALGQWIARERRDRMDKEAKDTNPSAQILASLDIAMDVFNKEPGFFLLRGAPGIDKIFRDTKWENGAWMPSIRKYEGAFSPVNPIYFSNIKKKGRAIGVRFDILPDPTEAPIERDDGDDRPRGQPRY